MERSGHIVPYRSRVERQRNPAEPHHVDRPIADFSAPNPGYQSFKRQIPLRFRRPQVGDAHQARIGALQLALLMRPTRRLIRPWDAVSLACLSHGDFRQPLQALQGAGRREHFGPSRAASWGQKATIGRPPQSCCAPRQHWLTLPAIAFSQQTGSAFL